MTIPGLGITTRYIFLACHPHSLRGSRAEFLHFGVPVTRYAEPLEALVDLAHDPHAALVIAAESDADTAQTERILELASAIPDRSLYLAVREGTSARTISAAARAGVRATLALPLTPHGLKSAVGTHPGMRPEDRSIELGDLIVHLDRQSVSWKGETLVLPAREFLLLSHIARAYPDTIPLETLSVAYGVDPEDRKSSVRTTIARLRRRLRDLDPAADFIQTVQFAGYCLTA